jgi:hypothetical protein
MVSINVTGKAGRLIHGESQRGAFQVVVYVVLKDCFYGTGMCNLEGM